MTLSAACRNLRLVCGTGALPVPEKVRAQIFLEGGGRAEIIFASRLSDQGGRGLADVRVGGCGLKGQYLIVDDAELDAIEIESTHTIDNVSRHTVLRRQASYFGR